MMTELRDSRSTREELLRTSGPYQNTWGQPSISHYILRVEGSHIKGELISGVYAVSTSNDEDDDEMSALIAAYDEIKSQSSDAILLEDAIKEVELHRNSK